MTRFQRAFSLFGVVVISATYFGVVQPATHADAAVTCPKLGATQLMQSQAFTPSGGHQVVVCTAKVRSFDGTPLHVDVTLPTVTYVTPGTSTPAKSPLVILHSGYSTDVCQFESTTFTGTAISGCSDFIGSPGFDWNNAWFASHGYVVLTYTPRGWYDSCGKKGSYSYSSDPLCKGMTFKDPNCSTTSSEQSWIHLYDRRWEVRDAQYLAGLIIDSGFTNPASPHLGIDPNKVVVSGDSGGGGPTWDLAFAKDTVVESCSTYTGTPITMAWKSPKGVALHLAAAVPMFTWTDLIDALLPNGRASDGLHGGPADGNRQSPIGVDKQSYVFALHESGVNNGQYAPSGKDPDINAWYTAITNGEPYNPTVFNPIVAAVGGQLRSPFRIPVPTSSVKPIYAIQGLTDPLFPAMQTVTEVNRLKAANASYPVWAFFADVGHHYASNPLAVWQAAHNASNAWLQTELKGGSPTQPAVTVDTTSCLSGQSITTYTASTFAAIATSSLAFSSAPAKSTTSSTASTSEGSESDAVLGGFCKDALHTDGNQATYTFAVPSKATLVGSPVVHVTAAVTLSGTTAELTARLWDIYPGVNQSLISRTVYRVQSTAGTHTLPLAFELWQNAWQLQCGHQVRLELTQDDGSGIFGATWRPDSQTSSMSLSNMSLSLPVVPGATCSPSVSAVAPGSGPAAGGTPVTVAGSHLTGATAVKFGSTPAASFTVNSDTQITATSPAGTGTVDLTVTTAVGTSATSSADQFTYIPAPAVTGVSPNNGASAGGDSVVITGSGFTGATAVDFGAGNPAATFTVDNDTQITVTSPPGSGTVDVTVTTSGGTSATSIADQYTYV